MPASPPVYVATPLPAPGAPSPTVAARPGWALQLGAPFGIAVYLHASFILLVAWVVGSSIAHHRTPHEIMSALAFVGAVFAIIVMHELGHALMARRFGIATRSIVLLPIGGVASLEKTPEEPSQELLVALAGPAVNVALALVFAGISLAMGVFPWPAVLSATGPIAQQLVWINVTIAVFNLIPAFPMDGGRVLRAALAFRMGRDRATAVASRVGQGFALLFGAIGFFTNPMLVVIAMFVWIGAGQEAAVVKMRSALHGLTVRAATITEFLTVSSGERLASAVEHGLSRAQHDFPVVDGVTLIGVLTRSDVLRALAEHGPETRVGAAMRRTFRTATPEEALDEVMPRLLGETATPVMVVEDTKLVGMLTSENVAELLLLRNAAHV